MRTLQERMTKANALLAPYAVPHEGKLGRANQEPPDATRFPFQRDRDRIIHTQSFRRLKGKTQVFVTGGGDHFRTRLTHTFEVAQISRDIARTLGLNEDLSEAIALAHDLGHPPFGHAGEEALDLWMRDHGSHFEHNAQSLRIVTLLEERSSLESGLNLNREILLGLQKHTTPHDLPAEVRRATKAGHENTHMTQGLSLEAQVVNLADEIAYTGHDVDDGLRAKLFSESDLKKIPLAEQALEQSKARGMAARGAIIDLLITDLYACTEELLRSIHDLDQVYASKEPLVRFSGAMKGALGALREFLWKRMYLHLDVLKANEQGKIVVRTLCKKLTTNPTPKVLEFQKRGGGTLIEAVKDYVAGMTDEYAQKSLARYALST